MSELSDEKDRLARRVASQKRTLRDRTAIGGGGGAVAGAIHSGLSGKNNPKTMAVKSLVGAVRGSLAGSASGAASSKIESHLKNRPLLAKIKKLKENMGNE